ncbi:MAG: transcription antitermination factor NusB [Clostridiales bacterium]|nr:transcription antitermination factor NusB [Clostridiales bacterium]
MSRIETREHVLKFLYQNNFRKEELNVQMEDFKTRFTEVEDDYDYFSSVVKGLIESKEDIDSKIIPFLKNWKIERLPILERAIMEIAVFEILYCEDIPTSVSINEAVKLAKKYGNDKSSSYINGVLSNFEKSL